MKLNIRKAVVHIGNCLRPVVEDKNSFTLSAMNEFLSDTLSLDDVFSYTNNENFYNDEMEDRWDAIRNAFK